LRVVSPVTVTRVGHCWDTRWIVMVARAAWRVIVVVARAWPAAPLPV